MMGLRLWLRLVLVLRLRLRPGRRAVARLLLSLWLRRRRNSLALLARQERLAGGLRQLRLLGL